MPSGVQPWTLTPRYSTSSITLRQLRREVGAHWWTAVALWRLCAGLPHALRAWLRAGGADWLLEARRCRKLHKRAPRPPL